jgi:hypothetical protein
MSSTGCSTRGSGSGGTENAFQLSKEAQLADLARKAAAFQPFADFRRLQIPASVVCKRPRRKAQPTLIARQCAGAIESFHVVKATLT